MNELTNDEEIKYDNKHEWYGLTPANREALVLDLIQKGYTADDLNKYFNVNSPRVINDFMNRRGYSKRNNIYIPKQQADYMDALPIIQNNNNLAINNIQIDEDTILNLLAVSKQSDKIQEIITWFDTDRTLIDSTNITGQATTESYIEVIDTSLPIPKTNQEDIRRTTIRVDGPLMDEFNHIWKTNFPEHKQHNLLNLALQMFIDKYK